jgi:hypothetical protein
MDFGLRNHLSNNSGGELAGQRRSLRQIVSEKDFDADALLIGIDRFA